MGGRLVLGRDPSCDIVLDLPQVSRRHAELYRQGPLYALRDLGSSNGSFVDGQRVEHATVPAGSLVRFGDWLGLVETEAGESPTAFSQLATGLWGGRELARALELARRVAPSDLPVVLEGATGTGKELFARVLHSASERSGPFHAVNCAALPAGLAEGELFGYRSGAFTGASRSHQGQLRAADGGTLLLDEIGDLPLGAQSKLLRALELGEVTPLGETKPVAFNARIVVAGQVPLAELVAAGTFRPDLAARIAGITIRLPCLKDRRGDVPGLFFELLRAHGAGQPPAVSAELYERLCLYAWPGNVRELGLLVRQLLAVHGLERQLAVRHLPEPFHGKLAQEATSPKRRHETRREHDLSRFTGALKETGGNVKRAAQVAGISRQRAYRLMKDLDPALPKAEEALGGPALHFSESGWAGE